MRVPALVLMLALPLGVALPAMAETAKPQAGHGHGGHDAHGKPGAGAAGANPAPASVGGAISGQEDAAKGAAPTKGNAASGLNPGK